jgi:hypothetical protein
MIDAVAPVAALTLPVKATIEFESEMTDVQKMVEPKAFDSPGKRDSGFVHPQISMAFCGLVQITAAAGQPELAQTKAKLIDFARAAAFIGVAVDVAGGEAGSRKAGWRSGMNPSQKQVVGLAVALFSGGGLKLQLLA